jgi:hypothetical protein
MSPTFYIVLFSASLLTTYALVRLSWVRMFSAYLVGSIINSAFFFLFSIARGNVLTHAIIVGVLLGVVFTGLAIAMAGYFKASAATDNAKINAAIAASVTETSKTN